MPVIHLMFRKDDLTEGGPGILRSRLQSCVKWSDVSSLETELDKNLVAYPEGVRSANFASSPVPFNQVSTTKKTSI